MSWTKDTPQSSSFSPEAILSQIDPDRTPVRASQTKISRRNFLKVSGGAATGFILAFSLPRRAHAVTETGLLQLNAFVQISPDGSIHIYAKNPEVGQGVKTSLPLIIAEEMDADWAKVSVKPAPVDDKSFGRQTAGGSRSVQHNWDTLRKVGAAARQMLLNAAARRWSVPVTELSTNNSRVIHEASGRQLTYADLAAKAATMPIPSEEAITLKKPKDYTLLGKRMADVDINAIVTGKPLFGIDQTVPGMLHAVYEKCPAVGGVPRNANLEEIKKLPGVTHAFILGGNGNGFELKPGVAIVATTTWAALQAKAQLIVAWDETNASKDSWSNLVKQANTLRDHAGKDVLYEKGDLASAERQSHKTVRSYYGFNFVGHATMEPQNCTAHYKNGAVEVWAPTQTPGRAIQSVANVLGIDQSKVTLHQIRAGGGFGRRLMNDPACEAAAISQEVGAPVKLLWTREDDMTHDFLRAGGFRSLKAGLNEQGKITYFQDHLIACSNDGKKAVIAGVPRNPDRSFPAQLVDTFQISQSLMQVKTLCGLLRAPESNTSAWSVQSFIHELAVAVGRDHLDFLMELLGEPKLLPPQGLYGLNTGRAAAVIKLAAEKADWGKKMPKGRGLGLAFHFSHAGYFAEVAEVSVSGNKQLKLHRVTVAGDIGPIINLSGAEQQCVGSVVDGFSTMLGQEITMEDGYIDQTNFDTYELLRMADAPDVDVHFIQSDNHPTGAGEPALPPLAPAVCNAIFSATGERVRKLPLSQEGYYT